MDITDAHFTPFLIRAKQATYAAGETADAAVHTGASRPASHDLTYCEGDWVYLDTYLGGYAFAGEEAVWYAGVPLWAMNYYGSLTVELAPDGFGHFLKQALLRPPAEAPFRGPATFTQGRYTYACAWVGELVHFRGEETIAWDGQVIYRLDFHGGAVKS